MKSPIPWLYVFHALLAADAVSNGRSWRTSSHNHHTLPSLFVFCLTLHILDDGTRGVDSSLFSQLPQNHDRLRNVKAYHEFSYAYYKW